MAQEWVLENVTPTAPPKYVYRNVDTDETKVTYAPLPNEEALGNDTDDGGDNANKHGSTTYETPSAPFAEGNTASIYGNTSIDSRTYKLDGNKPSEEINQGPGVRSLYNKWALHSYKNHTGGSQTSTNDYENYNKATFAGNEDNVLNPTAHKIVEYSSGINSAAYSYTYSDFIQCEHYGQISNEYMITLRRFAYPIQDDLLTMKKLDKDGASIDMSQPDLARAITWMSPALGNDMKEVLKFGTSFPWKDVESQIQEVSKKQGDRGKLGQMMDGSSLGRAFEAGINGYNADQAERIRQKGEGWDPMKETYPNKVFGPLNVIKKVLAREQGLDFSSEFTLTFHYDLKGYYGTSPKIAFMDTLSNILALTYNNAPFWGGAVRYTGSGSVGAPFGDFNKLKNGDYAGYLSSLTTQLKSSMGTAFNDIGKAANGLLSGKGINALGDSKIMDNIIGGGLMKLMNGPQGGQVIQAFLTGDPTGQWHMTVGNPMNPMMVVGNLALQSSNVEFEGPLGYEGFPSKMKVTVTLKPARPRDKGEIESMFNAGRGRIYLQPEVEGAVDLDKILDVSAYGNKDIPKGFARRLSDIQSG